MDREHGQFVNLAIFDPYISDLSKAIRKTGEILGTDIAGSTIYLVDLQDPKSDALVVHQFPNDTCITGITEVQEDVFYTQSVLCDIYNFHFQLNSTVVWEVDMRHYSKGGLASVRKLVDIPEAGVLNGMTLLSDIDGTVLMADSTIGVVWRLNVNTGSYRIVINDSLLSPNSSMVPPFGVNGIRVVGSVLYFTNFNHGLVGKFPISGDGLPTGPGVNISTNVPNADDFAVDSCGNIWLCENIQNTLVRVFPDGRTQAIVGAKNSTELVGPVAAIFGRTHKDRDILYISTDGLFIPPGSKAPVTNNGKIAAIDTETW